MTGATVVDVVLQNSSGDEGDLFFLLLFGFCIGLYLVYDGFDTWKMSRLIQDTPTAKIRSMAVGRTELEGTVREHDEHIDPPYIDDHCVFVRWEAERREKHRDEDGHVHYTWDTVAEGSEALAFALEDETGQVLVRADLDEPEFDIQSGTFNQTINFSRGQRPPRELVEYIGQFRDRENAAQTSRDEGGILDSAIDTVSDFMEADNPLTNTSRRRRYTQTVLPIGTDIYLFGSAEPRQGGQMKTGQQDLLEIHREKESGEFLISDMGEEQLQEQYSKRGPLETIGGIILSAVSLYFLLSWFVLV